MAGPWFLRHSAILTELPDENRDDPTITRRPIAVDNPTETAALEPASRALIRRSRDRAGAPQVPMMPLGDGSYIVHPRALRPEHLATAEECSAYMNAVDRLAVELRAKLVEIRELEAAGECDDFTWFRRTERLLYDIKVARTVAQDRRGVLARREKAASNAVWQESQAGRFLEAARIILTKEQYLAVWHLANAHVAAATA
jgi:hypothetical protein